MSSLNSRYRIAVMMKCRGDNLKVNICHQIFHLFHGLLSNLQATTIHQNLSSMSLSRAQTTSIRLYSVLRNTSTWSNQLQIRSPTRIAVQYHPEHRLRSRVTQQLRTIRSMAAETDTQASQVANTSGVTPESLQATLKSKLEAQKAEIVDISGW